MDDQALADDLDAELRAAADPERAIRERAYLKSELEHYGTRVPAIRVARPMGVDDDFWIRRSALLGLLAALRRGDGDFERFGRCTDAMLDDHEFFIRKAIGWVLRDTGRRRPDVVYEWLLPRAGRASAVTLREAVKPLSAAQREAVLSSR